MRKCVIIMNPNSGKKKKVNYKEFYDILRKHGYDGEIKFTKGSKDATKIVQQLDSDVDLVISAGGDGTLNEVVTGNYLRKERLTLANLPLGTTNDVGSMYGLSKDFLRSLELILSGKIKKVDICTINNTPFIYVACLGDYIDMAYSTPRELKKKYGKIAYIMYGLSQLKSGVTTYDVKYKIDDEEYEGQYSFFFITNSSRVAGVNDIYYDIKLDDGMFEVAFAKVKNKKDMLKMLVLMSTKEIKDVPGITYYQTDNLEIEFKKGPKTSWCIDGEEYKSTKIKFNFKIDTCMEMLLPTENINKLFE